MGIFKGRAEHRAARESRIRDAAYSKAITKGKTPEQATKAAERAILRRRVAIITAVTGH